MWRTRHPVTFRDKVRYKMLRDHRFWDGTPWILRIPAGTARLTFHVLGMHPDAPVWLRPAARDRLAAGGAQGVRSVTAQPADQRRRFRR